MPRKSQFTDEQIIRAIREVDAGEKASTVCRKLGVTEKTFYRWRSKFGGMEIGDAKKAFPKPRTGPKIPGTSRQGNRRAHPPHGGPG